MYGMMPDSNGTILTCLVCVINKAHLIEGLKIAGKQSWKCVKCTSSKCTKICDFPWKTVSKAHVENLPFLSIHD